MPTDWSVDQLRSASARPTLDPPGPTPLGSPGPTPQPTPLPPALLSLEVVLRAGQPAHQQDQLTVLAARLGYRAVWLEVDAGADRVGELPARIGELALRPGELAARVGELAALAGGADIGVAFAQIPSADLVTALPATVLLEMPPPGEAASSLAHAVGGPAGWRHRVRIRGELDPAAAGIVLTGADREALLAAVHHAFELRRDAVGDEVGSPGRAESDPGEGAGTSHGAEGDPGLSADTSRGPSPSIVAAVSVAIGRTVSEAAARASRAPHLEGDRDPRRAGLFGTFEDAQAQVLALAQAGADTLLATLPEDDVADLLAQLRSAVAVPAPLAPTPRSPRRADLG